MGIKWLDDAEEHDYPAAENYLSLLLDRPTVKLAISLLEGAKVIEHRANDVLRASALPLLGTEDQSVRKDLDKVKDGEHLSPVLLVVSEKMQRLIVADGYHRICAIVRYDTKEMIRCKLVYV